FTDRHRREGCGDLECASHAAARDFARRKTFDTLARQCDRAGIGGELPVDQVEAGRLAGAIRPDQRHAFPGVDAERHIDDGIDAAKRFAKSVDGEHGRLHRNRRPSARCNAPPMPIGKTITIARIAAPSTACQYSVTRDSVSESHVNATAPINGPAIALRPPSNTITSPSTERGMASVSGEMLPLENAYSAPASPANPPESRNASQRVRPTSMPIASARKGESRPPRKA